MKECKETCDYCKGIFIGDNTLSDIAICVEGTLLSPKPVIKGEEACPKCLSRFEKAIKTAYYTTRKEIMNGTTS